jgi:pimeloyl-ACP methyl ester carboxylesterase
MAAAMNWNRWLGLAAALALGYGGLCLLVFLMQRAMIYMPQPAADPSGRLELRVEGKRILVAHHDATGPAAGASPGLAPGTPPGFRPRLDPPPDAGSAMGTAAVTAAGTPAGTAASTDPRTPRTDPGAEAQLQRRADPSQPALIYFGGNAEDVSITRNMLAELLPDTDLYLLHYRGYGGSEGHPSEAAIRADAWALYAFVAQRHRQVSVAGRSLGTGPAVHLAALQPVQRLVLLVPFDSLLAVARAAMPWLPVDWLLLDRWEADAEAPKVKAPTTIVAAPRDQVVPVRHAEALAQAFQPGVAQLVLEPDLDHNTPLLDSPAIRRALRGGG